MKKGPADDRNEGDYKVWLVFSRATYGLTVVGRRSEVRRTA